MSTHTPTPWEVGEDVGQAERCIVTAECRDICTCETGFGDAEANAAFIVRVVNCHDDLLAALRALLARMEGESEWLDKAGYPAAWMVERHDNILTPARAAIAKATR